MNIFDSKEFQDNILDQVNAMNKLQVEAFNAGYKQGLIDGKAKAEELINEANRLAENND